MMRVLAGEELTGNHAIDVRLRESGYEEVQFNVGGAPLRNHEEQITRRCLCLS